MNILDFLTELYEQKLSYSAINSARSALSTFVDTNNDNTIGNSSIIKRFMKGLYHLNPPMPRYTEIWDVKIVLTYIQKLYPLKDLSLKDLTLKLVMLMALVTAQRAQTLHLLSLDNMSVGKSSYTFLLGDLIKQSKPTGKKIVIKLLPYTIDKTLCVVKTLQEYLERTEMIRKDKKLFISFVKPHKVVSKETLSRWVKIVLGRSGIDIKHFKAHSTRAASVSAALRNSVNLNEILATAGWSNANTFFKFYNKDKLSSKESQYASKMLN